MDALRLVQQQQQRAVLVLLLFDSTKSRTGGDGLSSFRCRSYKIDDSCVVGGGVCFFRLLGPMENERTWLFTIEFSVRRQSINNPGTATK